MNKKERYAFIVDYFRQRQPEVTTELLFDNPFQLLVATMLSAQCTDKRINMVTPPLFRRFPNAEAMAKATEEEILTLIKSVSYPNAKAKHLSAMSRQLVAVFNGVVPETIEQLTSLPGVGRKTANVVLSVAFQQPTMAVDTHVFSVKQQRHRKRWSVNLSGTYLPSMCHAPTIGSCCMGVTSAPAANRNATSATLTPYVPAR